MQQVNGNFLFYGRYVNGTMLMELISIASAHESSTEEKLNITHQFLDYNATHPDTVLTYTVSDMVLAVHSDGSYTQHKELRRGEFPPIVRYQKPHK